MSEEILKVISPLGVAANLEAIDKLTSCEDERREALVRQLEQFEYEAQRAFEQYDEVDARNRLAAAELERRWNAKLQDVERVRARIAELERIAPKLSTIDRERILAMGESFEDIWKSKHCPGALRKKIARDENLDAVQKGELVREIQRTLKGDPISKDSDPEMLRDRIGSLLEKLDARNVKARGLGGLVASGLGPDVAARSRMTPQKIAKTIRENMTETFGEMLGES